MEYVAFYCKLAVFLEFLNCVFIYRSSYKRVAKFVCWFC